MKDRQAAVWNGQLQGCPIHDRKRQWKSRVAKPTNKCLICWLVWLADKTDWLLYQEDIEAIIQFSNAFPKGIKPSTIEYIETAEDA